MSFTVPGFPNTLQTEYARIPKAPLPGSLWEGELFQERPDGALIAKVDEVAYAATVTIANFNSGDEVGINVNGVIVAVTAVTDADATAVLLDAKINNAGLLDGVLSSTVAGAALTLAGALGQEITVTEYSPDATTAAVTGVTASVVQTKLDYGYGVAADVPSLGINYNKVKKPSSLDDDFAGVLVRTNGSDIPPAQMLATDPLFDPNYLMPGQVYARMRKNAGVVVLYVGDAPAEGDPVYWICTGANAGLWRKDDGGTAGTSEVVTLTVTSDGGTPGVSQQSTLTVTSVADGNVGFTYDGLPALSLAATGNATNDAASLYALWLGNASYMAITDTITDNLDGTLTIVFNDSALHTFADVSTGSSSVAENIDVANVAFVAGGALAFNYDGLPDLSIAAGTGNATNDAATLYGQWIASAAYNALGSIVDNLDGTLTITFADDTTHTFTDNSAGGSSIAEVVDTPAVAAIPATAKLIADYSWGRPSIPASADVPARAFLRLSNP